jgi:hypothetical protein
MGGNGSGGARIGAGRKSKTQREAFLHGARDRRPVSAAVVGQPAAPVQPPRGLSAGEKAVWKVLAPLAQASLTLTDATAGAFGDLCKAIVLRDQLRRRMDREGWTFDKVVHVTKGGDVITEPKKHPLFSEHRAWQQRVEAGQTRFRLTAFGKEIVPPDKPEDPFSEFEAPAGSNVQ